MRFWNTTVHSSVESPCSSYTLNFSIVLLQGFVCSSLFFFFSSRRRHTRYIGDLEFRRVLFRSTSRSHVYQLIQHGALESLLLGGRRRIPRDAVEAFIAREREAQRERQP